MVFRHSVNVTLKELSNLVTGDGTACYVYYQKSTDYLPYNWSNLPPTTNCLLIARNMDQWRASLMADSNLHFDKLEPKGTFLFPNHLSLVMLSYFFVKTSVFDWVSKSVYRIISSILQFVYSFGPNTF